MIIKEQDLKDFRECINRVLRAGPVHTWGDGEAERKERQFYIRLHQLQPIIEARIKNEPHERAKATAKRQAKRNEKV